MGDSTWAVPFAIHPAASVTTTIYVPAVSPVAVWVVCAGMLFHRYVYDPVPPVGEAVAVPLLPFRTVTGVALALARNIAGCKMVTLPVAEHPAPLVTVTVYVPAVSPDTPAVVAPLFHW